MHVNKPNYPTTDQLLEVFSWGDKIHLEKGNEGYLVVGKWEALCLSLIIREGDTLVKDTQVLYDSIYEEIQDMKDDFLSKSFQEGVNLIENIKQTSVHRVFQVFGLFRIWGHPTIDPLKGIVKLKKIACLRRINNKKMTDEITCIFKERFISKHYELHGAWPDCDISKLHKRNVIRQACENNAPFPFRSHRYHRVDLIFLSFNKNFNINQKLNPAEMMSDNSLSLTKTELINSILEHKSIGKATDKAVVVQWLKSTLSDPEQFLKLIGSQGFASEESVFGVCGKERELKLFARFFGLSTLLKRMYIVITEAILASVFLKYFPEITMMDDSLTLLKKFHSKTKGMKDRNHFDEYTLVTNIDFEKWNSHMRESETYKIFECFDQLIGINTLYTRTHEMFSSASMYLADGSYLPNVNTKKGCLEPGETVWTNHLGGIEGLRQKGWTIFTVCVLYKVMEQMQTKFTLMGQGDNQVMLCYYPKTLSPDTVKENHSRLILIMEEILSKIGPPLKKEETWSSSWLLYGKYAILEGAPMSVSLKKMCRMMTHSNEGFPTLETSISSIASNASAATVSDFYIHIIGRHICVFQAIYLSHIWEHLLIK